MLIDTHAHIYPTKIAAKAARSVGDFYGVEMSRQGTLEGLLRMGKTAGITHFVVHSVATTPHQVTSINDFIAASVKAHPDMLIGLGTMHPGFENIDAELDRMEAMGLRGMKLHPDFQQFAIDDPCMNPLYERVEGRMPILFHTGDYRYDRSHPRRLREVLRRFPDLQVVGAHFGGWSICQEGLRYLADTSAMVDCSSSAVFLKTPEAMAELIRAFGAERVMFGTDYPMGDAASELAFFDRMDLTAKEREKILWQNAAEFYHITQ